MPPSLTRPITLLLVAIAAVVLIAAVSQTARTQTPEPSPLASISGKSLESAKVKLTTPSEQAVRDAEASTSKEAAEFAVLSRWPGAKVTEARLLEVEDHLSDPPFRCLCWVVVVDRPDPVYVGGPAPAAGEERDSFEVDETYRFDLIDAVTGKYLYGVEGAVGRTVPASARP